METALQVLPYAKKIYILESTARVTADQLLVEKVSNHKQIILLPGAKIQKVGGSDFVEEILFEQSGRQQKLSVQGILINVGYESHVLPVDQLVALNNKREIIVDKWQKTNQLGFFAAGACTDSPYKQIITAAGDGCRAALSAFDYLSDIEPSK
jgi:thioredoxin reductase